VLLVTANVVPSSLMLFNLMLEAIYSSETPVLIRATGHHIPEDDILQRAVRHRSGAAINFSFNPNEPSIMRMSQENYASHREFSAEQGNNL
jgi:3'-phosphoadenosine 5'-phosphosulfate sulfotransferase (PAPS reductase)/FAD synthetase